MQTRDITAETSVRGDVGDRTGADARGVLDALEHSPIAMLHVLVVGLCACGFAIDLVDLALGSALSAVFAAPPHNLGAAKLSWMLTSVYFGAVVGAPIFGWIADRIGPKKALCIVVFWLGVSSLMSAAAPTAEVLTIVRLIAGVGIGAYPPVMMAYLTDVSPNRRRGAVIFSTCAIAYLAPPLAIFGVRWLTPVAPFGVDGWRWPFAVAGLMSLAAGFGFIRAPEAPHWLAATGRIDALRQVAARMAGSRSIPLFAGAGDRSALGLPSRRRAPKPLVKVVSPRLRLLVLSMITFTVPIATVSFPLVTGPILLARHFSLSDTLFYVGLATFGPIIGTLVGGFYVDGFGRRAFMAACGGAMLASVGLFFLVDGAAAMAVALVGFSLFTALYMPTMTMYGAELFEPSVRGRATSIAWVANRIAAAGAPAILIPLLHARTASAVGLVLGGSLVLNILVVAILAPRTGRELA